MSPQVKYALKQAGVMLGLAAIGIATEQVVPIIPSPWGAVVGAALPAAYRWVEGLRDAQRAAEGKVIPSDVAAYGPRSA